MRTYKLRILHISDLHAEGPRQNAWRRQRVLGEAWRDNLEELLKDGPFDLVCSTGDVANWGKADEYSQATEWLTALRNHLKLDSERLFVVPGNHDIDRSVGTAAWQVLRDNYHRVRPDELASWMKGGKPPLGFKDGQREELLSRQAAYRNWVDKELGHPELLPEKSPHGKLGYRRTLQLSDHPFSTHIIGLDSAWASGDNHDAGKLLLTDEQVGMLTTGPDGRALTGFRLALIHHPLTDLFDNGHVSRLLADNVDLLLRGHLHEETVHTHVEPSRPSSHQVAAGCLYQHDHWSNACHALEVELDESGRPLKYELRIRTWSTNGYWFDDGGVYQEARGGRLIWRIAPAPPPPPPRPPPVFVGREDELRRLASAVLPEENKQQVPVSIRGMPGVGKTNLAEQFFALNKEHFPGGLWPLLIDLQAPQPVDVLLGQLAAQLELPAGRGELERRLQERLRRPLSLLLVENVDSQEAGKVAAALARRLPQCPLVFTGRFQELGASEGWVRIDVPVLDEAKALEQLEREWQPPLPSEVQERKLLVNELGFLPLALHLAAGYLRTGAYDATSFLVELRERRLKLEHVDPATRLDPTRSVLASTFGLSMDLLRRQLGADAERILSGLAALAHGPTSSFGVSLGMVISGLSERDFRNLLLFHAHCLSLVSRVSREERPEGAWRFHPLVAEFLRNLPGGDEGFSRMTSWFLARLPALGNDQAKEQGERWKELYQETTALVDWLRHIQEVDYIRVAKAGRIYGARNGPYVAWTTFYEQALRHTHNIDARSELLWALALTACRQGDFVRALEAADEKRQVDQKRGAELDVALAAGLRADILWAQGQFDEALRIRREEELPIYEKHGEVRSRAITLIDIASIQQAQGHLDKALRILREEVMPIFADKEYERSSTLGKIADILQTQGQFDEALRIRREEELPVHEKLGDVRERAITQSKIADILWHQGQFDEALRILREEVLPVSDKLGDVRERAAILRQIAGIFRSLGKLNEALRLLCDEVLPALHELGDAHFLLFGRFELARLYHERNQAGDRDKAVELLQLALSAAEQLGIPEAEQIREFQQFLRLK